MYSRLVLRKAFQVKAFVPSFAGSVRFDSKQVPKEGPERDLVNFPRPVMQEFPSKVRYGFIPEEWFDCIYHKTGVTGPYMLGLGVYVYLLSKEVWVIEHDFYLIYGFFGAVYFLNRKIGKAVSSYLDKKVDLAEAELKSGRVESIKLLEEAIKQEKHAQWQMEGQTLLTDAKRENVKMQLEASYRERAMHVYQEVKKRLDFQVEKQRIDQIIAHKHMVQWVVSNVLKSISEEQEKQNIKKCLADLESIANKM